MTDPTADPTPGVARDTTRPNADPTHRTSDQTPDPTPDPTPAPEPEHPDVDALAIPAAAERLGLTTDAVRMRLKRGTLAGRKVAGRWVVLVPRPNADQTRTERDDPTPETATQHPPERSTERDPTTLAPLADLIAELARRNEELAGSVGHWQARAISAEERLKMLEAGPMGPIAGDAPQEAMPAPAPRDGADDAPRATPEASPWRRVWRRLTGTT